MEQHRASGAAVPGAVEERRRAVPEEGECQAAVDRTLADLGALTPDLLRVVLLARSTFDVPFAQLNLVTHVTLHSLAFAGRSSDRMRGTLSEHVVETAGATLIADTRTDARFAQIAETHGRDAIRFYIGYPIQSLDGFRIGTLCVFDTVAHPIEDEDEALIRDVAILADAEVNAISPPR